MRIHREHTRSCRSSGTSAPWPWSTLMTRLCLTSPPVLPSTVNPSLWMPGACLYHISLLCQVPSLQTSLMESQHLTKSHWTQDWGCRCHQAPAQEPWSPIPCPSHPEPGGSSTLRGQRDYPEHVRNPRNRASSPSWRSRQRCTRTLSRFRTPRLLTWIRK